MFDFDTPVERRNTRSLKWDIDPDSDVVELWVADMDFTAAPVIREALEKRVEHGVFGYAMPPKAFYDAIVSWNRKRHGVTFNPEHIIPVTGVVPAMAAALQALCLPGEEVIIQTPAYNCFFSSLRNAGVQMSANPMIFDEKTGRWSLDFEDLERRASSDRARVLLFCNPQNPTGHVWSRTELVHVADICRRHNVILITDEIHGELTAAGHAYVPLASVSEWARENVVTLSAASKGFNLAGLQTAYVVAADPVVRSRIDRQININEVCDINPFGIEALIAAYSEEGAAWLDALNVYLDKNRAMVEKFVAENPDMFVLSAQEGTYLPWIRLKNAGMTSSEAEEDLLKNFRVRVNGGAHYGELTPDWIRLNIATSASRLEEGLKRIGAWAEKIRGRYQEELTLNV